MMTESTRSSAPRGSTSYVVEIGRLLAPSSGHASTSLELDSNESLAYWLLRDSLATAQQRASFVIVVFVFFNGNVYTKFTSPVLRYLSTVTQGSRSVMHSI